MGTRILFNFPVGLALALALPSALAAADSLELFNGRNLAGWQKETGDWTTASTVRPAAPDPKRFSATPGEGVLFNGDQGRTANLLTELEHGDCELHVEFCVPKDSNSGVYLMGRYEVQILDSFGKKDLHYGDCGGIYASCSEPKPDFKGRAPSSNASKAPGAWQTFDIVFRAPRFDATGKKVENARFIRVAHNGTVIHENVEVPRPTCAARWLDEKPRGPIMLQGDHGPVAYRNLRLLPREGK